MKWEEKNEDENGLIIMKECIYKGNFDENNKFIGKGTLKNEKGEYIGEFKNGKKHGKG